MKALELAKRFSSEYALPSAKEQIEMAAELRSLAEVNAELLGALADIRLAANSGRIAYIIDRVEDVCAKAKEQQ